VDLVASGNTLTFGMTIEKGRRDLNAFDRSMAERREDVHARIRAGDPSKIVTAVDAAMYRLLLPLGGEKPSQDSHEK
jgi:hypothetical protein